eukprot:8605309-Alexandrium_andersonii.AAC.1
MLYRRWASIRLKAFEPKAQDMALSEICAGFVGGSAVEGAWQAAFEVETATLEGLGVSALATDIRKAFDQLS